MPRSLVLLFALANLAIGTAAFVLTGILPAVAQGLSISVPVAGQLITAYALATAFLAPLALVASGAWPRRRALVLAMALFTVGCLVCAVATSVPLMMLGRVLMGIGAMTTPLSAGIVLALTPPLQRGRTLALVFLGTSVSYMVGLPLGNWMASEYGWRSPLWLVAVFAACMTVALAWVVPRQVAAAGASFKGLGMVLRQPAVVSVLGTTGLYFTAIFCTAAYMVPAFAALVSVSANQMALSLMMFGAAGVVGTLLGGFNNDRFGPRLTMQMHLSVLALMMVLMPLTQGHLWALRLTMAAWAVAGFGMMAPQQTRLATLAPPQAPLLLSLNASMLYLGTAGGAALGGWVAPLIGYGHLSWAGLPLIALALLLLSRERPAAAPHPA